MVSASLRAAVVALAGAQSAAAQTATFTSSNGRWAESSKWSSNPGAASEVVIDASGIVTVQQAQATPASVVIEGELLVEKSLCMGDCGVVGPESASFEYNFVQGWNWISIVIEPSDPDPNKVFPKESLTCTNQDAIKNSNTFTQFYDVTGFQQWFGALSELKTPEMLMMKLQAPAQKFTMSGPPATLPMTLPLTKNWNWLAYPYLEALPLKDAIDQSILVHETLLKDSSAFTQWYDISGFKGWLGDAKMDTMTVGMGYKIKMTAAGTLVYPPLSGGRRQLSTASNATSPPAAKIGTLAKPARVPAAWSSFDEHAHPESAGLNAVVELDGDLQPGGMLAAFIDGEIRGLLSAPTQVPKVPAFGPMAGRPLWPISVLGKSSDAGKAISFQFSADGERVHKLSTQIKWARDTYYGDATHPTVLK